METEHGLLRLELLEDPTSDKFVVMQVHKRGYAATGVSEGLAAQLQLQDALKYQTVFPERSRWRLVWLPRLALPCGPPARPLRHA